MNDLEQIKEHLEKVMLAENVREWMVIVNKGLLGNRRVVYSTDDRIEQINSARSGISKAEQRLYSLDSEIKKRFDALKELSEIESNSSDGGESTRVTPAKKDLVRSLKREGWSPAEIAKRVRISESEVALILELPE